MTDGNTTTTRAEGMFRELLWVHAMIRRDLRTVQRLADRVLDGATADEILATIRDLQTEGPLWKLKVNCLAYCRFVHTHHSIEDWHLFPVIRDANPELATVVDRLEADHLQIAEYLQAVEIAANGLTTADANQHRECLVIALQAMADHLLTHLEFEEESIGPVLSEWTEWPDRKRSALSH